jgi:hypothetical protein
MHLDNLYLPKFALIHKDYNANTITFDFSQLPGAKTKVRAMKNMSENTKNVPGAVLIKGM